VTIDPTWRGEFTSHEANLLHAEAFGGRVYDSTEWDWRQQVDEHSLGWVTVRSGPELVGFVNVVWDGLVHAWIQDLMVAGAARHRGIGRELISTATIGARRAGCEWLHVDFEDRLAPFYFGACGFEPTSAGLLRL
jgi:ribosomal protein S18 acetylase RimI-like enzyme